MKICYTSYRYFPDGPVTTLFDESDPANIAYALQGDYFSFYSLKTLSPQALKAKLQPYDYVFVALDTDAIQLVHAITSVCEGRAITYSENHIGHYQQLRPAEQVLFVQATRLAAANFLFWKKYIPFYQALTPRPVDYLPLPYQLAACQKLYQPLAQRPKRLVVPTGLHGATRNGLVNLLVAKQLLAANLVDEVVVFLDPGHFNEDLQASAEVLLDMPSQGPPPAKLNFNWREWLLQTRVDYRRLLKLKQYLRPTRKVQAAPPAGQRLGRALFYPRQGLSAYLAIVAQAHLMVDMHNRETVGRTAADCAALGLPCVSTNRSDLHEQLFPATTLTDSWDVPNAVALSQRLLTDANFYHQVTEAANQAVQALDIANLRERLLGLFAKHQLGVAAR